MRICAHFTETASSSYHLYDVAECPTSPIRMNAEKKMVELTERSREIEKLNQISSTKRSKKNVCIHWWPDDVLSVVSACAFAEIRRERLDVRFS